MKGNGRKRRMNYEPALELLRQGIKLREAAERCGLSIGRLSIEAKAAGIRIKHTCLLCDALYIARPGRDTNPVCPKHRKMQADWSLLLKQWRGIRKAFRDLTNDELFRRILKARGENGRQCGEL